MFDWYRRLTFKPCRSIIPSGQKFAYMMACSDEYSALCLDCGHRWSRLFKLNPLTKWSSCGAVTCGTSWMRAPDGFASSQPPTWRDYDLPR